ncbi:hypothetical protein C7U89_05890 [Bradyrhizobium sp. WBOS4]|nr:hypothetical protein [Bradyrhizobium sp. WBOS8]MDD1582483.1 hypothetical protein [Bradyrhizobium sp. WBOS4]UUO51525.1 hypothetical protein DCM78_30605 [Bradyrhizobium sp. WBOS04]UUO63309.1 hypothetical protein DCM80_03105 [Bradyrhizobium sp. WBOS08]
MLDSRSSPIRDDLRSLVSFWAQSYPYRYAPRRRCPLVRVETPYGWYWDRVCGYVVQRQAF